jgi:hypothetical protein
MSNRSLLSLGQKHSGTIDIKEFLSKFLLRKILKIFMILTIFLLAVAADLTLALTPNQKINNTVTKIVTDFSIKVQNLTQEYINDQKTKTNMSEEKWDEIEVSVNEYTDDLMNRFANRTHGIISEGAFKVNDTQEGKLNGDAIQNANLMMHQISKAWVEEVSRGNGIYRRSQIISAPLHLNLADFYRPNMEMITKNQILKYFKSRDIRWKQMQERQRPNRRRRIEELRRKSQTGTQGSDLNPESQTGFQGSDSKKPESQTGFQRSSENIPESETKAASNSENDNDIPIDLQEKNQRRKDRFDVKNNVKDSFWQEFKSFFDSKLIKNYTKISLGIGLFYILYDLTLRKEDYPELM